MSQKLPAARPHSAFGRRDEIDHLPVTASVYTEISAIDREYLRTCVQLAHDDDRRVGQIDQPDIFECIPTNRRGAIRKRAQVLNLRPSRSLGGEVIAQVRNLMSLWTENVNRTFVACWRTELGTNIGTQQPKV